MIKPLILDDFYGPLEPDDVIDSGSTGVRGKPPQKTKLIRHMQKAIFIDEVVREEEEEEPVFLEMPESEMFCSGDRCVKA